MRTPRSSTAAAKTPNSLVKRLLDQAKRNDEAALRTLDYFDPRQLAPRVRVPVLLSACSQDDLCPPATIESVHDRLAGVKMLKFYPDLAHTSCLDFDNFGWMWLEHNFRPVVPR